MMAETNATADGTAISAHLHLITRRWAELGQPAMIELRAFAEHRSAQTARFRPDWIDEPVTGAAAWAAEMNALKMNVYAVINPIRDGYSGSAKDTDIVGSFYLWADCDDENAARNVLNFVGPKWTAAVTTGTIPTTRAHVYWELEEPCLNLDAWRAMQSDIAATFQSDRSVINPSRIMRLAGTITYPDTKKQGRGYVNETARLRTEYDDGREPIAFDRMRQVFAPQATQAHIPLSQQAAARIAPPQGHTAPQGSGFQIDTGAGQAASLDRERARIAATSGMEWHNNVIALVASYVAKGLSDADIHVLTQPLTLPGYTGEQTAREVQTAIDGARRKGWTPDPTVSQFREMTAAEVEAVEPMMFAAWEQTDLSAIPHPDFVYSDFYARGYTSVTVAPPKVGKSMLGLAEAVDIATGRGLLTGVSRQPLKVVYYNAEDDQAVINARVAALLCAYGIEQEEIIGRLYPVSGVEKSDFYMVSGQEGIVNEPLFVALEKFIKASGADVLIFDPLQDLTRSPETNEVFRVLGQRLRRMAAETGVALGLIHHTRKIMAGVKATIDDARGGSALRGTARFNRLLVGMTEEEGTTAGVENHRHYMRIGDMESNLAPPSADVNRWFEKASIKIPNGHYVGVIKPWDWPDAFDGISRQDAAKVRSEFAKMMEAPRANIRSKNWAGTAIGDILNIDTSEEKGKAKVKFVLAKWIETDVLRVEKRHDARTGREVEHVIAGDNNPASEVSE